MHFEEHIVFFSRWWIQLLRQRSRQSLDLDEPQSELHLVRSCFGVCKLNHILCSVSSDHIEDQLGTFDDGLHFASSSILKSSISDTAWTQATLPFRLALVDSVLGELWALLQWPSSQMLTNLECWPTPSFLSVNLSLFLIRRTHQSHGPSILVWYQCIP